MVREAASTETYQNTILGNLLAIIEKKTGKVLVSYKHWPKSSGWLLKLFQMRFFHFFRFQICSRLFPRSFPDWGDPCSRFPDFQISKKIWNGVPVPRSRFGQRFPDYQIVPDFGIKFPRGFDNYCLREPKMQGIKHSLVRGLQEQSTE